MAKSLGAKLTELRIDKNQSLQQTADAIGVSKAHIYQLEKGKTSNPSLTSIQKLADHYGVSMTYLIGEDIDASDADPQLQKMFRQAKELDPRERSILDAMLTNLLETREKVR